MKNAQKINEIGEQLAKEYGISFLPSDFKKKNGYKRSVELSEEYGLYRQDYCGCIFSRMEREEKKRSCEDVYKRQEEGVTKKIVFSGDIGNKNQPLIKDPQKTQEADYVVMESTYGDRLHPGERPDYIKELTGILKETFDKGGNVVIPSFAVGRTQEMLYFIRKIKENRLVEGHEDFPDYVDLSLIHI